MADSTSVSGNLSGDLGQPDTGPPPESGNPPSDSSNIPSELHVHSPNLLYPNELNVHTTTAELSATPLNRIISRDGTHHLERIRIPVFAWDKMKYQQWDAAFTSCVDQAPLTAQFKMLRLESCLRGEAAETIKGLGYSKEAYDAARARLARKYGGSQRQVQSHLEELKKLKPLQQGNAKDLEAFADVLERAVICLKENGRQMDLDAGTLYTIVLEKIPEQLLSQYYRWLREHQRNESMETLKDWISQEAEYQVQAAEIKHGFPRVRQDKFNGHDTRGGRSYHGNRVDGGDKRNKKCAVCGEIHPIWRCSAFKVKSADEKWRLAKKFGLCYRCLGDDHLGNACRRSKSCNIGGCKENHHYLLHQDKSSLPMTKTKEEESKEKENKEEDRKDTGRGCDTEGDRQSKSYGATQGQETQVIALRTVPVILKNGDRKIHVNCLLDEGSDTTCVNEDVVEALGLQGSKTKIEVKVANDETVSFMSSNFLIGLESVDGRVDTKITAQTSKKICGGMKPVNWIKLKHNWEHLSKIHFPKLAPGRSIDILLGADHHELMYSMKEIPGKSDQPSARLCPLGWTAVGKVEATARMDQHHTGFHHIYRANGEGVAVGNQREEDHNLNDMLKRFWDLESIGVAPVSTRTAEMSPNEKLAWKKVSESVTFHDGYYQVAVPWKKEKPSLPNNAELAKRRLRSTERKLAKDPEVAAAYQRVINEYLEKKYIRRVPPEEPKPECEWLLPHFPVVRPEKETTKVRIVFDGSSVCDGKSLNTEALPGPKLQSDITDILIKFRKEPVALAGDISQMYHQLVLRPEDRPLHRFLWRNLDPGKEPEVYEFLRFIFGGCYCPFCAQYTWQKHAEDHRDEYPLAAAAVQKNCYMDDLMPSVENISTAKDMRQQLTELGDRANFHVRKWISNRREILEDIPDSDRASEINLEKNELPVTKTLGVSWTATDDQFLFHYTPPSDQFQYTKRNVLRSTATIFDPMGFLAPFVVRAKLLMQQAWVQALDWDEPLTDELQEAWRRWFGELVTLHQTKIPRCLKEAPMVTSTEIHAFSDASEKAYAAAVYARYEYIDGSFSSRLVAAKTRLAPLKTISVPRLELMSAVISLRLSKQVCQALDVQLRKVNFWIDSMTVGYWIRGQSRNYKPFVAHRIGEIHQDTNPTQWRHVPTATNPADYGTRGLTVAELNNNDCWWNGPKFLRGPREQWPEMKFETAASEAYDEVKPEGRNNKTSFMASTEHDEEQKEEWRLNPTHFSKWYRNPLTTRLEFGRSLVRVRGWVQRFIKNCRKSKEDRIFGQLKPEELKQVEEEIIREAQIEAYRQEFEALTNGKSLPKQSSILNLSPIMYKGLLRSNTRLRYSEELTDSVKYPIILPKRHPVTQLIVKYHHETEGHEMGVNFTLNHLRERYMVVNGRELVKRTIKACAECKRRFRGKAASQQMAPLPKIRLELTMQPFTNCSVDFAGPFFTKQGRGRARIKRYLCLFLCLQTHCCHLEMVWSLESEGFLQALTRMAARRGWPRDMVSDNGTNFVGGNNELRELVNQIDKEKVESLTSNKGVNWHWNPPASPHFGGVFERMIKAAKRAINAILRNAEVNDEELETTIIGVESLINSRPLTRVSGDPNDEPVLTPNHFLIGKMGGDLAPESVDYTKFNPKKRWRRVQELIRQTWQRWMREYLTTIGSRSKWCEQQENVKKDDVVLVIDPGVARRNWKLGIIENVYPGKDDLVRVVDVKEGDKVYRRSIGRISPLEFGTTN